MARMTDGVFRRDEPQGAEPEWRLVPLSSGRECADRDADAGDGCASCAASWAPVGPGWHDSSWLLRRGLEVTELRYGSLFEGMLKALQTQSRPSESVLHAPA